MLQLVEPRVNLGARGHPVVVGREHDDDRFARRNSKTFGFAANAQKVRQQELRAHSHHCTADADSSRLSFDVDSNTKPADDVLAHRRTGTAHSPRTALTNCAAQHSAHCACADSCCAYESSDFFRVSNSRRLRFACLTAYQRTNISCAPLTIHPGPPV